MNSFQNCNFKQKGRKEIVLKKVPCSDLFTFRKENYGKAYLDWQLAGCAF